MWFEWWWGATRAWPAPGARDWEAGRRCRGDARALRRMVALDYAPRAMPLTLRHALAVVFLSWASLAGCASERWVYAKPDVTPARVEHDLMRCRRASPSHDFSLFPSQRLDSEAVRLCMERRGYTATLEPR